MKNTMMRNKTNTTRNDVQKQGQLLAELMLAREALKKAAESAYYGEPIEKLLQIAETQIGKVRKIS